jgi:hypothetical protein
MSSLASPTQLIWAVSGLAYTSSVTSVALAAALGSDPRRRQHARETLKVLLRAPGEVHEGRVRRKDARAAPGSTKKATGASLPSRLSVTRGGLRPKGVGDLRVLA